LLLGSVPGVAAAQSGLGEEAGVVNEQQGNAPSSSGAARPGPVWTQRRVAFDAHLGMGTPLGLLGGSLEVTPVAALTVGAGVGTSAFGPQVAGLVRLRTAPRREGSFYVGGGYSQGRYEQGLSNRYGIFSTFDGIFESMGEHPPTPWRSWQTARWLNLEIGADTRRASGLDARGFLGIANLLNPNQNELTDDELGAPSPLNVVPWVIYCGMAIGYSL